MEKKIVMIANSWRRFPAEEKEIHIGITQSNWFVIQPFPHTATATATDRARMYLYTSPLSHKYQYGRTSNKPNHYRMILLWKREIELTVNFVLLKLDWSEQRLLFRTGHKISSNVLNRRLWINLVNHGWGQLMVLIIERMYRMMMICIRPATSVTQYYIYR